MAELTPELASAILDHLGPPRRLQTRRDDIPIPSPSESITVTLPEAPSANAYWRRAGTRIHVSAEAKAYKEAVSMLTSRYRHGSEVAFPSGDLSITVLWHR